jgi:Uri superfamily endonuclease
MMPAKNIDDWIKMKGVYILIISVIKNVCIKIGSLGKIKFPEGMYVYVGSAQNNLEKRVARHISKDKKKFWHIDYLLGNKFSKVVAVFYKKSGKSEECNMAKKITNEFTNTEIIIPKFGCSDCSCKSHLFKIKNFDKVYNLEVKKL